MEHIADLLLVPEVPTQTHFHSVSIGESGPNKGRAERIARIPTAEIRIVVRCPPPEDLQSVSRQEDDMLYVPLEGSVLESRFGVLDIPWVIRHIYLGGHPSP